MELYEYESETFYYRLYAFMKAVCRQGFQTYSCDKKCICILEYMYLAHCITLVWNTFCIATRNSFRNVNYYFWITIKNK